MKITIKRYDPSKDVSAYEATYDVPHNDDHMTLLQALVYIHENLEPLAFDFSCRGRMCGRCAMMLDGEPVLACVEPLTDKSHTVEPLAGFPVVRDLVVDRSQAQSRVAETYRRVRIEPLTEEDLQTYNQEDANELFGTFVAGQFVAGSVPFPALLSAITGEHPGIGKRLPTGHDRVHDLIDIVELPPLRLIKGVSQRLLKQLF